MEMSLILNKRSFCFLSLLNKKFINRKNINIIEMNRKSFSKTLINLSDKTVNESNNSKDNNRREPYSSLYVSGRYGSDVFNVLQPKFDENYLNNIINNINYIKLIYIKRNLNNGIDFDQIVIDLKKFIQFKSELKPLKLFREKFMNNKKNIKLLSNELSLRLEENKNKIQELNEKVWDLEEIVMPFVLNIPNDIRYDVNQEFDSKTNLMSSFEPKRREINVNLDYNRLSYINKCFYTSIVGPNSSYLLESGAQLHHSLIEYFSENLRRNQFIDFSGIDFVKSAIIEATNCQHLRDFRSDSCRIERGYNTNEDNQHLHLVGNSSFESICALISKRILNWTTDQIRLISIGQQFEPSFKQNNSINASIISKENISDNEMKLLYQLLWNCFTKLDIKCRAISCSVQELNHNEYARYDIQVWLNSQNEWLTASQIIHYKDYIAIRIGISDAHIIYSSINLFPIIISIIEQNQTIEGNFETPECLKPFLF